MRLNDIKLNGKSLNLCNGAKLCMITPDSGTSLITVPSWAMKKIESALPPMPNCENKYGFGTLTFVIDGVDYNIPSHHFMEKYINVNKIGDHVCMTSIQALDIQ